jgi:hypothetical protein
MEGSERSNYREGNNLRLAAEKEVGWGLTGREPDWPRD